MADRLLKFEATGNDFLVVHGDSPFATPWWAEQLCNRRTGIGADGLLVVETGPHQEPRMIIYNADGTRPEMCGNGVRCVAAFLKETKNVRFPITIVSDAGPRKVYPYQAPDNKTDKIDESTFTVDMGPPAIKTEPTIVLYKGKEVRVQEVNMGNPHAVCFDAELYNDDDLWTLGQLLNRSHPQFPHGVNLEVVDLRQGTEPMICRVFERGVGETHACGTGACAVAVAAVINGIVPRTPLEVRLPGGPLIIDWQTANSTSPETIMMTGSAHFVAQFRCSNEWLERHQPSDCQI